MGEVIRFVPKSERERARLIREARAIYDSVFPPSDPVRGQRDKASQAICASAQTSIAARGTYHDRDHRRALQFVFSGKLPRADRHHLGLR